MDEAKLADYLGEHGIRVSIRRTEANRCPRWQGEECDHVHGDEHTVTVSKDGRRFAYHFWNSYNDASKGIGPSLSDVLGTFDLEIVPVLNGNIAAFSDFVREYGGNEDSYRERQVHRHIVDLAHRAEAVLGWEDIERIAELARD